MYIDSNMPPGVRQDYELIKQEFFLGTPRSRYAPSSTGGTRLPFIATTGVMVAPLYSWSAARSPGDNSILLAAGIPWIGLCGLTAVVGIESVIQERSYLSCRFHEGYNSTHSSLERSRVGNSYALSWIWEI